MKTPIEELKIVFTNTAGIDIGSEKHFAAVGQETGQYAHLPVSPKTCSQCLCGLRKTV